MTVLDVLVVGAGPAGSATALEARARGLDVLVVDKAGFPRDKTCGDGLTARALRLVERLGVDAPALAGYSSVRETVVVSPSGRRVRLPLPTTGEHSAVVPRAELDAALVGHVRTSGVEVREHAAVVGITDREDAVRVDLSDGTPVDARFVVAADGHWSAVRRLRGVNPAADLGTSYAFRQYFGGVEERRQWVLFEPDLLPGYVWVFPLPGGRANVDLGVPRDGSRTGKQLAALWRAVLDRPSVRAVLGPDATPEGAHRAWPIPAAYDSARLTDGRVLFVGDAASVVDPLTGEGISQALETGILAAAAVARGGTPARVATTYCRTVGRAVGRDLRFARRLLRVVSSPAPARAAVRTADLCGWTRRSFARWMFESYPRALLLTPDRWRPDMFTRPGAFAGVPAESV